MVALRRGGEQILNRHDAYTDAVIRQCEADLRP
jgi:hypothetical protein